MQVLDPTIEVRFVIPPSQPIHSRRRFSLKCEELGTYFVDAAQQKLAEAACLFDLSEHRLHHLLSQSVRRFEAAVVDLFAHQLRQRSTNFSVCRCRVLGASRCDTAVDTTCYERFEIGFAAVARVR